MSLALRQVHDLQGTVQAVSSLLVQAIQPLPLPPDLGAALLAVCTLLGHSRECHLLIQSFLIPWPTVRAISS